ncbi:MAG: ComEC/Rec2 family competence protein, partial [Tepidiformaceae bacterium]
VFSGFNYRGYLARHGVVGTMAQPEVSVLAQGSVWSPSRLAARARLALDSGLQRSLPEPEASLAGGIAFGRDGNLSEQVYGTFRDTGLAHIVAVSGSNVTLVMAVIFFLCVRVIGRRAALLPAGLTVVAYLFIAGLSASVVRAGLMAVVYLAGVYLGRQQAALAALGAAAIAMTLVQPSAALDLGFQLSLAATAGLIVFGPWVRYALRHYVLRGRVGALTPESAVQVVALTVSATIATMPIAWLNFGRISLIGPVANVIVEPVFVIAFWLSALTAVLGAFWQPAGWAAGLPAYYPLSFMTWFARHLAAVPGAAVDVPGADGTLGFVVFAVLCAAGWPAYRYLVPDDVPHPARPVPGRRASALALAGGAACLALVAFAVSLLPMRGPGELRMTVLDVGQGDAVLFTTPSGRHVLVDGGASGIQLARELGAVLPHWERSLDAVFVTLPQEEHAGAIPELLDRFNVGTTMDAGFESNEGGFGLYAASSTNRRAVQAGDHYDIDGIRFDVLSPAANATPAATNDGAVVLLVRYGTTSFILPSNASARIQQTLVAGRSVAADVLVVPHHGANTTDIPFIQAVAPALAVIPKGSGKFAPEPAPAVLDALGAIPILRTDDDGRVMVASNGRSLVFEAER